jgi:hypothetical protein
VLDLTEFSNDYFEKVRAFGKAKVEKFTIDQTHYSFILKDDQLPELIEIIQSNWKKSLIQFEIKLEKNSMIVPLLDALKQCYMLTKLKVVYI